ncbi:MAG: C-GCAxxG-C-C family protein [Clostridia bacterium]|nr:C-GCAxxG-C-C family protein [Clostridia bacterium]
MTPEEYGNRAEEYFREGYNCAQAVALAFSDKVNIDKETLLKAVSVFGGGVGGLREMCGAVSGTIFIYGLLKGYNDPTDNAAKTELYKDIQEIANRNKEVNGSYICKELLAMKDITPSNLPSERTEEYYKRRPCPEKINIAAKIFAEFLEEK